MSISEESINLTQLINIIKNNIELIKICKKDKDCNCINNILKKYDGNIDELKQYIYFDKNKNYTRNLISTDNESYSLMLLCWNKNKFSPIHNHPCDGCWLKIIQGSIQEIRYNISDNKLNEIYNNKTSEGVFYMHDSIGLHKIGNPDMNIDAITIHLYAPPFNKCNLWPDIENSKEKIESESKYDTINGKKNK